MAESFPRFQLTGFCELSFLLLLRDRFIDGHELREMVGQHGKQTLEDMEREVDRILLEFDDNNDGYLNIDEFMNSGL